MFLFFIRTDILFLCSAHSTMLFLPLKAPLFEEVSLQTCIKIGVGWFNCEGRSVLMKATLTFRLSAFRDDFLRFLFDFNNH